MKDLIKGVVSGFTKFFKIMARMALPFMFFLQFSLKEIRIIYTEHIYKCFIKTSIKTYIYKHQTYIYIYTYIYGRKFDTDENSQHDAERSTYSIILVHWFCVSLE